MRGPVWSRLGARQGSFHGGGSGRVATFMDRLGPRMPAGNSFLQLLRSKADGRCYNCFARDHRIAHCRDPPRCVLCYKSGHKARYWKNSSAASVREWKASSASVGGREEARREEGGEVRRKMVFTSGEPGLRPSRVTVCAARTVVIGDAERDIQLHSLIGVQLDATLRMSCEQVHRDVFRQLNIPGYAVEVTMLKAATFLLRFAQPAMRNTALGRRQLTAGGTRLHVMTWTRQFGAEATSSGESRNS